MNDYWQRNRDGLGAYGVFTFAILVTMISIKRGIHRRFEDEDELAPIRAIFDRPIALTLLLSAYLGYFISPEATRAFTVITGPLMLLPAVLILRSILERPLFPILNLVIGLFLVEELSPFIEGLPNLPRFVFMLEMLVIALFLSYWLRPARLFDLPLENSTSVSLRVIGAALKIGLGLSLFSFAAEVAGFRSLGELVGGSLISASFAAVIIYGATRVLDGVLAYSLRIRPLRLLGMVSHHRRMIRSRGRMVLQAIGWYVWVTTSLRSMQILDDVEAGLTSLMERELPFAEVGITIGDVVASVLTFWLATLVSRFVRFLLEEDVYNRLRVAKGRPYAISTLIHYTILMLGFTLALVALGFDVNRFTLLAGAFGVGIGFGLQTIVNNFISGIILLTERPVEVGDTIAIGSGNEVFGEVHRIGIRSSTIRTWQGAEVIVPNADLIAGQVTNWTLSDRRRRMEIPVGVAYGTDPERVIEVLLAVTKEGDEILAEPAPYVLFLGFGESSLDFEVRAWTDEFDSFQSVRSATVLAISGALRKAAIEIPFPQRDLHLKTIAGPGSEGLAAPAGPEETA
jgi:small-conductance mechanosensitive channel